MKLYLAYGSNLHAGQMADRCPDAIPVQSGILPDYKLVFRGNSHTGVANIEPSEGHQVPYVIWAISEQDEQALDFYEGYPHLYTKIWLDIEIQGLPQKVMAYVMTPGHKLRRPSAYYLNVIREGYEDFGLDYAPLVRAVREASA